MTNSTMFESSSAMGPSSFDRASTLRQPLTPNYEFGKSFWDAHRNIWETNEEFNDHKSTNEALMSRSIRQGSISSKHLSQSSQRLALTPIDNPSATSSNVWNTSLSNSDASRQNTSFLSPTKRRQNGWLYNGPTEVGLENVSLLAGSAPEVEASHNGFSHRNNPPGQLQRPSTGNGSQVNGLKPAMQDIAANSRLDPVAMPAQISRYQTNGTDSSHFSTANLGSRTGPSSFAKDSSVRATAFQTTNHPGTGSNTISPRTARFLRQANRYLDQSNAALEETTDAFGSLMLGQPSDFSIDDPGSNLILQRPLQDFQTPIGIDPTTSLASVQTNASEFGTTSLFPDFQPASQVALQSQYSSVWQPSDRRDYLTSHGNYKPNLYSPHYSAAPTPPTGPDSTQSATESRISSRTSYHDAVFGDRKQSYDQFPRGGLSLHTPSYDFAIQPASLRMNPLAPPYQVTGYPDFTSYNHHASNHTREPDHVHIARSPLLEEFRIHRQTKRYELRDIFNHIVEFSGDQHGSRFIQLKLESANSDEKDQVFKEIQPNSLQLMTDVFGNYVIQKMFEHGNQPQKKVLANQMRGHVLNLSTQMYGCRVVQKALEHVLTDQQASMVRELDGPNKQILKVIRDQNGNHVVQKAIERVPAEHIQFIIEAHKGEVVKLATHTYGCRVIQRILEHCGPLAKRVILDELHGCLTPLITDQFGNYVVQHVIQKGEPGDRRRVISIVQQQLLVFSKHKFASNVVEKCIEFADDDQRGAIVHGLVGPNEHGQTPVLGLLRDQYGNYVIQRVYKLLRGSELDALTTEMKLCFPQLRRTSHGKQVMAIEKLLFGNCFAHNGPNASRQSSLSSSQASNGNDMSPSAPRQPMSAQAIGHGQPLVNLGLYPGP